MSAVANAQEPVQSVSLLSDQDAIAPSTATVTPTDRPREASHWFGRVGFADAIYRSDATIKVDGTVIPGSTAEVSNGTAVTFDVGYDITPDIAAMLMVGIPPKPRIWGQGTVATLGELGAVRYGPAIFTVLYRLPRFGAFEPYLGVGAAYAIILKDYDASVSNLRVQNNFGFVAQAGAAYSLNRRWSLYVDFKKVWLSVDAYGSVDAAPVTARVKLDPDMVTAGVSYHF